MSLKGVNNSASDGKRILSVPERLAIYAEEGMISQEKYEEIIKDNKPKKKKYNLLFCCIAIIIAILCIILTFNVFGHQGKTDSNGGHWNSTTDTYHYHCDGYPAHSHPNGVCPYKSNPNPNNSTWQKLLEKYGVTGKYANKNTPTNSALEYDKGYSAGKESGYIEGYDEGYNKGIKDAIKVAVIILIPIVFILLIVGLVKFIKKRKQQN